MGSNPFSTITDWVGWVSQWSSGPQVPRKDKDLHHGVAGPGRVGSAKMLVQRSHGMRGTLRPVSFLL